MELKPFTFQACFPSAQILLDKTITLQVQVQRIKDISLILFAQYYYYYEIKRDVARARIGKFLNAT
jgi:hypothetical protein